MGNYQPHEDCSRRDASELHGDWPRRFDLTRADANRIDELMEEIGETHSTVGPRHDPYGCETTVFDMKSPLAKLLMRKGLLFPGAELYHERKRYGVTYEINTTYVWAHAQYNYGMGCQKWSIRRIAIG